MSKQPPANKFVNFYHTKSSEVKRLDSTAQDFATRQEQLKAQGWTRDRFAQSVFHKRLGTKVVRSPEELAAHVKQGWKTQPIIDAKEAQGAHADAVHPHYADDHRVAALANQAHEKD